MSAGGLPSAAGTYTVTAAFAVYIDGANKTRYPQGTAAFTVEIARAVYDMSTVSFDDATYTYDGTERTLVISGELPEGVTVTYSANTLTDAGEIEVTAAFAGDRANYDDIGPMTAMLTIEKATPVYEVPENLTAVAGQTLADIALPGGLGVGGCGAFPSVRRAKILLRQFTRPRTRRIIMP